MAVAACLPACCQTLHADVRLRVHAQELLAQASELVESGEFVALSSLVARMTGSPNNARQNLLDAAACARPCMQCASRAASPRAACLAAHMQRHACLHACPICPARLPA